MATLVQNSYQAVGAPLPPDLEPDDEWKQTLKMNIEAGLRSMVDEAKQKLNDELAKGIIGPEARDRLTADHLATLETIRQLAKEQFQIALERERQERRWASGEQLDRAWSESMLKEQQAILDRIEKERENKAPATSPQLDPPQRWLAPPFQLQHKPSVPPPETSTFNSHPSNRKAERVARTPTHFEHDEPAASPDEIPSFRPIHNVRAGSIGSVNSWKAPSISDTQKFFPERSRPSPVIDEPKFMPRSATPTNPPDPTRRENTRRGPSTNGGPNVQGFWKPSMTPEEDAQMSRASVLVKRSTASATSPFKASSIFSDAFTDPLEALSYNVDQEQSGIYSVDREWSSLNQAREKNRGRERPGYGHTDDCSMHSSNQRLGDHATLSHLPTTSQSSRVHVPLLSAGRPIVQEFWKPSITPEEDAQISRTSVPAKRRGTASTASLFKAPSVAYTDPLEALFIDVERERSSTYSADQEWRNSGQAWERRCRESETKRKEEEGKRKEQGVNSREVTARQKGEETGWKEGVKMMEEEARQRQEEVERREEEARRRTEEAILKAGENRKKEEVLRKQEDELRRREEVLNRREAELRRREDKLQEDVRKREEEIRRQKLEERKKQETLNSSGPWPIPNRSDL